MIIDLKGIVENVEGYEGKNGYGANISISQLGSNKKRSFLTINIKDKSISDNFESLLQEEVNVSIELIQNNFGIRLGNILDIKRVQVNK